MRAYEESQAVAAGYKQVFASRRDVLGLGNKEHASKPEEAHDLPRACTVMKGGGREEWGGGKSGRRARRDAGRGVWTHQGG